jgi:hypothetical protein
MQKKHVGAEEDLGWDCLAYTVALSINFFRLLFLRSLTITTEQGTGLAENWESVHELTDTRGRLNRRREGARPRSERSDFQGPSRKLQHS